MAKLALGEYELELVLDKISEHLNVHRYSVKITCTGVNVFEPWIRQATDKEDGLLPFPTCVPFDEYFRPLLSEEWPIKLDDIEDGQWMTVIAWPSAFLDAVELMEPNRQYESDWEYLGEMAKSHEWDPYHPKGPKNFRMERCGDHVRLSFGISISAMGVPPQAYRPSSGWGRISFDAYVEYDALERFLDELKAEREALVAKSNAGRRKK